MATQSSLHYLNMASLAAVVQYVNDRVPISCRIVRMTYSVSNDQDQDFERLKQVTPNNQEDRFPALILTRKRIAPLGAQRSTDDKFVACVDNATGVPSLYAYRQVEAEYEARYYCAKNKQLEAVIEGLLTNYNVKFDYKYNLPWLQDQISSVFRVGELDDSNRRLVTAKNSREDGVYYKLTLNFTASAVLIEAPLDGEEAEAAKLITQINVTMLNRDGDTVLATFTIV